jgi:hypothetical protein
VISILSCTLADPYSTVSFVDVKELLLAYSHTSSKFAVPDPAVCIVVPSVAVAATKIPLPFVEAERGILLKVAIYRLYHFLG